MRLYTNTKYAKSAIPFSTSAKTLLILILTTTANAHGIKNNFCLVYDTRRKHSDKISFFRRPISAFICCLNVITKIYVNSIMILHYSKWKIKYIQIKSHMHTNTESIPHYVQFVFSSVVVALHSMNHNNISFWETSVAFLSSPCLVLSLY